MDFVNVFFRDKKIQIEKSIVEFLAALLNLSIFSTVLTYQAGIAGSMRFPRYGKIPIRVSWGPSIQNYYYFYFTTWVSSRFQRFYLRIVRVQLI